MRGSDVDILRVKNMPRPIALFFVLGVLLTGPFACAPPPSHGDGTSSSASGSTDIPELTEEIVYERINEAYVDEVPEESGTAGPIAWGFDEEEPKEITVVEKQVDGASATIVLDIKTGSHPRARNQRYLAGQIRTRWELRTGWVLRRWEIVETENISMKYKNLPPRSPEPDSDR